MQPIKMIAVTGGPCGGKTTFLAQAFERLARYGIHAFVVPEVATEFMTAGVSPALIPSDIFQEQLMRYLLEREARYRAIAKTVTDRQIVLICDRGIADSQAYMDPADYTTVLGRVGYAPQQALHRYDLVVHLVSAADGAEEFYTCDNNTARTETPEEAKLLDARTLNAWLGHPHQFIVDNSTDFETKMVRGFQALARVLDMPVPTEIERKFRVLNFERRDIPADAIAAHIEQTYLLANTGTERRLRKRVCRGETHYFFTIKETTDDLQTRLERERQISLAEYRMLYEQHDPLKSTIMKTRYNFPYAGHICELDEYHGEKHEGLVILEVEVQELSGAVRLPQQWDVAEVSTDPAYKNERLARLTNPSPPICV